MRPLSNLLPPLLRLALPVLVLLSTLIGIFVYGSFVTPYPAYLPGHGSPALYDPLHDNGSDYGWQEYAYTDGSSCKFANGAYSVNTPQGYHVPCYAQSTNFSDFAFEVDMNIINGECGGIIFRADQNTTRYYLFKACQYGDYALLKYVDNVSAGVVTLTASNSTSIKTGLGQFNQLAVFADGNNITLYINSQRIATVEDSSYTSGNIALLADGPDISTEVVFSNAKSWVL
jgi:hypothetical protein